MKYLRHRVKAVEILFQKIKITFETVHTTHQIASTKHLLFLN